MFETVIGLEVHAELATKSKIFCSCKNEFGGEPNIRCCPVCTGMPGALPVLNKEAVRLCILAGLATNCEISSVFTMARKNYFYPDLPKAYQITQLEKPLCTNGFLELSNSKKIRINRIHIEEDAGKLLHDQDVLFTFIDYNRCGIPLIEIVSEPDMSSADEALEFLEKVKTILKVTGVSDCKMQEGSLRCDVNISVKDKGKQGLNQRVEYKNLNSFSAAARAIQYEEARQVNRYKKSETVDAATMKWDDLKGEGILMRSKEEAMDYCYFPEPDIPPIHIPKDFIFSIKSAMPVLPDELKRKYINLGVSKSDADMISKDTVLNNLFEYSLGVEILPQQTASVLTGEYKSLINELGNKNISQKSFSDLLKMTEQGEINRKILKKILRVMLTDGGEPAEICERLSLKQISNYNEVRSLVKKTLDENPGALKDYLTGKKEAAGFLVGSVMKMTGGRANPAIVKKAVIDILENQKEK